MCQVLMSAPDLWKMKNIIQKKNNNETLANTLCTIVCHSSAANKYTYIYKPGTLKIIYMCAYP